MWDKKIAIFGASGATGQLLTERCLKAGHSVKALLRRPEAFRLHDRVEVVQGDVKDAAAVQHTVAGVDVVLSAFGGAVSVQGGRCPGGWGSTDRCCDGGCRGAAHHRAGVGGGAGLGAG